MTEEEAARPAPRRSPRARSDDPPPAASVRFSTPAADSGFHSESFFEGCSLSPFKPSRRSRRQEQEELRQLNDRLVKYIRRVWEQESLIEALQRRLAEAQAGGGGGEAEVLRRGYESELKDVRHALDAQTGQRAALQVELGVLRQEHRQLVDRNSRQENELSQAVAQMRDLEAQLSSQKAELATSLSRHHSLMEDLQELKEQTVLLKKAERDAKGDLQSEKLKTADLEIQNKTLQKEVAFLKNRLEAEHNIHERLHEMKQQVPSGHQQEFKSETLHLLQELRKEHEQKLLEYKDEMEQIYHAKLMCLTSVQSKNAALEARVRELETGEGELKRTLDLLRRQLAERDRETAEMRQRMQVQVEVNGCLRDEKQQMQARLEEYEHLFDVKLGLDWEISAYRRMLEEEERRLNLAGHFSGTSGKWGKVDPSPLFPPGRKRKRTVVKTRAHSVVAQRASASGCVSIEEIDTEGRFVKIKNNSNKNQLLGRWTLRRQHGPDLDIIYRFPPRFTLQAGQVTTIWGAREDSNPGPSDLVWIAQKSWVAGENVVIALHDADGKETAVGRITNLDRGEGRSEVEDPLEEEEEIEYHPWRRESRSCPIM
ncbi:lamin-L(III)-like [Hemicordylus capensis]|uniref:lamin-L(III)-like n=1 Tax=Hemicordylus capensis TaxID=884348 RepID=UPI002303A5EF|nr:lamin-L(III)-like [Hemicordylus capensis]